jgi:hypothetical protein
MRSQQMMPDAVLHGVGETPRYEPFPAPLAGDGEISLDIDAEPLARVEQVWPKAGSDRRVVFVP